MIFLERLVLYNYFPEVKQIEFPLEYGAEYDHYVLTAYIPNGNIAVTQITKEDVEQSIDFRLPGVNWPIAGDAQRVIIKNTKNNGEFPIHSAFVLCGATTTS